MEIDIRKEYNRLVWNDKINVFKSLTRDPLFYTLASANLFSTLQSWLVSNNYTIDFSSRLLSILSLAGMTLCYMKNCPTSDSADLDRVLEIISDKLRSTDTYNRLYENYDRYTTDIAKLFKELNLKSDLDKCFVFNVLLNYGTFSATGNYNNENFEFDMFPIVELLGSRVVSGSGVCRHSASFASDVLEKTGTKIAPLKTTVLDNDVSYSKNGGEIKLDHLVAGVSSEEGRFIYDPTNHSFGVGCDYVHKTNSILSDVLVYNGLYVKKCNSRYYIPETQDILVGGCNRLSNYYRFLDNKFMDKDMLLNAPTEEYLEIVRANLNLVKDCWKNELPLMNEIVKDESALAPHGDEIVKKWTID